MLITVECLRCRYPTPSIAPQPQGTCEFHLSVVGVPLDLKAAWVGVSIGTGVTSLPNNYP